ncbi:MAG: TetR/AcrR family transcriptional regulator [Aureispira sp.]
MIEKKTPKKTAIYEAAALLFRERGYKAASMRELAERVNLKVSSLYSHIGSKEELLQKICFDNAHSFIEGLDKIETQGGTPLEQLQAVIGLHVDIAVTNPTSVTVFNNEWRHLTDGTSQNNLSAFLKLRKTYEARLQNIIQKGIEQGELKATDPRVALYTLLTAVRWIHYWYKPSRKMSPKALKTQLITLLLSGLAKN